MRFLRVRYVASASNESIVAITPYGPMAIFGPDSAEVVFVFEVCRLHVTKLGSGQLVVSFPISAILTRAHGSVRLCDSIITARCPDGSVFRKGCHAVRGAVQ